MMNDKNIQPDALKERNTLASTTEIEQLQVQMQEINILQEIINVPKKDPGIDQTALKNREEAVIVDALKDRYTLPVILESVSLSKSGYYYQEAALKQEEKYNDIRKIIIGLFHGNKECYGYRRIYVLLKRKGITLSEKIVWRIMWEEGVVVKTKRRRKYSSYHDSPSVPNLIKREFHVDKPNEKWLTDIINLPFMRGKFIFRQSWTASMECFHTGRSEQIRMRPCGWHVGTGNIRTT